MQKEVKINDEASAVSITYTDPQKGKLTMVFYHDENAYYEYAEDPEGHVTMCRKGVELIGDIYLQSRKKDLISKFKPKYEDPVWITKYSSWIKCKYFEYKVKKIEKNDEVNLLKNLRDIDTNNMKNKKYAKFMADVISDILDAVQSGTAIKENIVIKNTRYRTYNDNEEKEEARNKLDNFLSNDAPQQKSLLSFLKRYNSR